MALIELFKRRGPSGFGYGSTAEDTTAGLSLHGETMLVTGCNSGLGLEAMRVLALRGAHVLGTARTLTRAQAACAGVAGRTTPLACELADPASVRACVATVAAAGPTLDAVVCNAGIMALPQLERAHGCELQLFTNHVGHFLLVTGLLGALSPTARVVVVSSDLHRRAPAAGIDFDNLTGERGYEPWAAYGQSKLANILFAKQLARKFAGSQRTANALHPGVIHTNLIRSTAAPMRAVFRAVGPLLLKSIPQGAATTCYLAAHPAVAAVSGQYFADSNVAAPRPDADDAALAQRLWDVSAQMVAQLP